MKTLRCTLVPTSPFATAFRGDSLFGQLCWAIRRCFGEEKLQALLEGYTSGRPFLIVGDPCPEGYVPRPALPLRLMLSDDAFAAMDKRIKKAPFLEEGALKTHSLHWYQNLGYGFGDQSHSMSSFMNKEVRMSNSISRVTGTTGEGSMFAPRAQAIFQFHPAAKLSCFVQIDVSRFSVEDFNSALSFVATKGFGKRSTVGFGQFRVDGICEYSLPKIQKANALLTLGRSVPEENSLNHRLSLFNTCTHFGRHGDDLAHGQVFKSPLLMYEAGAVLVPSGDAHALAEVAERGWVGRGLGGKSQPISEQMPETVHQGYAPVVPVCVSWERVNEH